MSQPNAVAPVNDRLRESLLFLCTANSARSQMAEGLAREILGPEARVQSAGSNPSKLNPLAVDVMKEIDIDISEQRSKSVDEIDPGTVATVITLCAEEICPVFLSTAERIHWPMPDPAAPSEDPELQIRRFRDVRDQLRQRLEEFARDRNLIQAAS